MAAVAIRFDDDKLARFATVAEKLRKRMGVKVTRSSVIQAAAYRGLDSFEAELDKPLPSDDAE